MSKRYADAFFFTGYYGLIALAILFALIPIVIAVLLSFDNRTFIGPFPPTDWSFRWYEEFLTSDYYHQGLKTSLIVSSTATLFSTVIGALAAIAIDRGRFWGRGFLQSLFISPLVIPTVVIGFGVLMFASRLGIVDGLPRLIMGHIIITFPYVVRTTLAALIGLRPSYFEAALSLGATPYQALWHITIPLARNGIIAGAIFAFVMSFDEVAVSLFLSDPFTYTLPVALLAQMRANLNLTIAAVSVIFIIVTIVLIWALDRIAGLDKIVGQGVYGRIR